MATAESFYVNLDPCLDGNPDSYYGIEGVDVETGERINLTGFMSLKTAKLLAASRDLFDACKEFVRKVESGEARSTRSYEQMKAAISTVES